jgi:hypothetical protein
LFDFSTRRIIFDNDAYWVIVLTAIHLETGHVRVHEKTPTDSS